MNNATQVTDAERRHMESWQVDAEKLTQRIHRALRRWNFSRSIREREIDSFIYEIKYVEHPGARPRDGVLLVRRSTDLDRIQSALYGGATVIAIIDKAHTRSGRAVRLVVRGKWGSETLEIVYT